MNILLVGAGQLGSRHLQSLLKLKKNAKIYVLDSSSDSLELSKKRAQEIKSAENHNVNYLNNLSKVDRNEFDFVIIATGASARFSILKEVLDKFQVKHMLLEKVLFQDLESYELALEIDNRSNTKIYVNCPLRVYPFFQYLKRQFISEEVSTTLNYSGGEWIGLGCNTIHYLDLLSYLTGEQVVRVDVNGLHNEIIESKRKGFKEFTGRLTAEFSNGSALNVHSIRGSEQDSVIEIINDKYCINIDELSGRYRIYQSGELIEENNYEILYQSNLTHKIIESLQNEGVCGLTNFSESVELHQIFIKELLGHFNRLSSEPSDKLPIT